MSNAHFVPQAATDAKAAAESKQELLSAWTAFLTKLPSGIPEHERAALCDIFKRAYRLTIGMNRDA